MEFVDIDAKHSRAYNNLISHPLQSYEWGEFREKTGVKVVRKALKNGSSFIDGFQLTLHQIPHTGYKIGYLPKGNLPTKEVLNELLRIGKENNCIFIQLEPNILKSSGQKLPTSKHLQPSAHPLFTKYTFLLDLTRTEEDLLKNMHSKTRYNIKVAQKYHVEVKEDNSIYAFERYLSLTEETTTRQKFYAHSQNYHQLMWETLKSKELVYGELSAHLFTATYKKEILTAWILFVFKDSLYYPYGASTSTHREVMANNLIMWEAIKYGKKLKLKKFDMWGALSETPDSNDPWFGFHRFKNGYGPEHVEFIGSFDLIINPLLYMGYKTVDKARWAYLRFKK